MIWRKRLWPGFASRTTLSEVALALAAAVGAALATTPPMWAVAVTALLMLRFRRTAPLLPFLAGAGLTALSVGAATPLVLAAYAMGRRTRSWWVWPLAAVTGGVAVVWGSRAISDSTGPFRWEDVEPLMVAWLAALLIVLPVALGLWQRTRQELLSALRQRALSAEAEREHTTREAVLAERTRIAGEMHDVVGHRVSLMALQAGAIEVAAGDAERVQVLAGQVQVAGRAALEELREAVGVLRIDRLAGTAVLGGSPADLDGRAGGAPLRPLPSLGQVPALIDRAREAGITVTLAAPSGNCMPDNSSADATAEVFDMPVDPFVGRAVYRVVQEGITNAHKHATDAPVEVSLDRQDDQLVVRVINGPALRDSAVTGETRCGGGSTAGLAPGAGSFENSAVAGADAAGPPSGGGHGLLGLHERVRSVGGRLSAEARPDGGFALEAVLPV